MGFPALELDADSGVNLRPLIGLQVWLFGTEQHSEWVRAMGPRVMQASPEGLYIHWRDLPDDKDGEIVLRPPGRGPFDLYDMVRLTRGLNPEDEEVIERESQKLSSLLQRIARWDKPAEPKQAPPAPQAAPAAAKPWWEE